jgi:hypothetical protein
LLDYDSNSRTYRVFNVTTSYVETTCDVVFIETNDSQKEQVDLDLVDDEEALCDALQRMAIGEVRPQDSNDQPQEQTPNDTGHTPVLKSRTKASMHVPRMFNHTHSNNMINR